MNPENFLTESNGKQCPERVIFHAKTKIEVPVTCKAQSYTKQALVTWVSPMGTGPAKPLSPLPPQYVACPDSCGGPNAKCVTNSKNIDGIFGKKEEAQKSLPYLIPLISKGETCCKADTQAYNTAFEDHYKHEDSVAQKLEKDADKAISEINKLGIQETSRIGQKEAEAAAGSKACKGSVKFRFPGAGNGWKKSGGKNGSSGCKKTPGPFVDYAETGPISRPKEVCDATSTKSSSVGLTNLLRK